MRVATLASASSRLDSMEEPPEGAMAELAEFGFGEVEASGAVERDVSVDERPEFEGDLPDIVIFEVSGEHGTGDRVGDQGQGGRLASMEVVGEAAGGRAGFGEDVVEEVRMSEGIIDVGVERELQAVWSRRLRAAGFHQGAELGEFGVGNGNEECVAARKVV